MSDAGFLARAYAVVIRGAARKKIYAVRAQRAGRRAEARLFRALAASEEVQARRLFNNFRGQIDTSPAALDTVFSREIDEILAVYETQLRMAGPGGVAAQVLGQLKRAETRLKSFYDRADRKMTVAAGDDFLLCPYCGYLATGKAPQHCPVCGAAGNGFRRVN